MQHQRASTPRTFGRSDPRLSQGSTCRASGKRQIISKAHGGVRVLQHRRESVGGRGVEGSAALCVGPVDVCARRQEVLSHRLVGAVKSLVERRTPFLEFPSTRGRGS